MGPWDGAAGNGYFDYDMSLMKNFYPIGSHENFSVQLRGDFINVLNHPNFADPKMMSNAISLGLFATRGSRGRLQGAAQMR